MEAVGLARACTEGSGVAEGYPPASLGRWFPFATYAEFAWVALEPHDEDGDCSASPTMNCRLASHASMQRFRVAPPA